MYVEEGQSVAAGAPVVQLRNVELASKAARSQSDLDMAWEGADALIHYSDFGSARRTGSDWVSRLTNSHPKSTTCR